MQVEVNDVKQNFTIDVREWHDGTGNRGAALQWVVGVPLKFIYSYATNEMFTITQVNGEHCFLSPISICVCVCDCTFSHVTRR